MHPEQLTPWGIDWVWGLPLIVITVMFHVYSLSFIKRRTELRLRTMNQTAAVGIVTLSITVLHAVEASVWALTFLFLGAVPDRQTAGLYSLNALTSFGHTDIQLERKWQLMGALESLNGWILFGLSTAYLFLLVQDIWSRVAGRTEAYTS